MKRVIRYTAYSFAFLLLIILIGVSYVSMNGIPKYEVSKMDYTYRSDSIILLRGQKLVLTLCASCHMNTETRKFTGGRMLDLPKEFGEVYIPNITHDKHYGIGGWTDGEILYFLRTGVKRDGQYVPPYMPKYPHMSDEDLNAIIAFLRSENNMVKADATKDFPSKPSFLTKLMSHIEFKPLPLPTKIIATPDTTDMVRLGKYLATNLDCYTCHSADIKTLNVIQPELSGGYFGGGNKPLNREEKVILTSNLTPNKETGIGTWSEEKFIKAVRYGIVDGEESLRYPMQPYVYMSETEIKAIYAYLQTIPAINNKVERTK